MTSGLRSAASLLATAAAWELIAWWIDSPVLPPCSAVIAALAAMIRTGELFGDVASSVATLLTGFSLAVAVGVPAGAAMGSSHTLARVLSPYLGAGLASPMLIYVPVLLTIGGTSRGTQVATVFLYSVFALTACTLAGVRGVNPSLIEMSRAFGATRRQTFWRVAWPAARPMMLTGLRLGVALAIKGMINGEMLVASTGIGAMIRQHGGRFEPAKVLALLLVVVAVALVATSTLRSTERRVVAMA